MSPATCRQMPEGFPGSVPGLAQKNAAASPAPSQPTSQALSNPRRPIPSGGPQRPSRSAPPPQGAASPRMRATCPRPPCFGRKGRGPSHRARTCPGRTARSRPTPISATQLADAAAAPGPDEHPSQPQHSHYQPPTASASIIHLHPSTPSPPQALTSPPIHPISNQQPPAPQPAPSFLPLKDQLNKKKNPKGSE